MLDHMKVSLRAWLLCVLLLFTGGRAAGQYVNLPLGHWAYGFLERMQAKGALREANLMNKPLSRSDVAAMVARIGEGELSEADLERLEWLREELALELDRYPLAGTEWAPACRYFGLSRCPLCVQSRGGIQDQHSWRYRTSGHGEVDYDYHRGSLQLWLSLRTIRLFSIFYEQLRAR